MLLKVKYGHRSKDGQKYCCQSYNNWKWVPDSQVVSSHWNIMKLKETLNVCVGEIFILSAELLALT